MKCFWRLCHLTSFFPDANLRTWNFFFFLNHKPLVFYYCHSRGCKSLWLSNVKQSVKLRVLHSHASVWLNSQGRNHTDWEVMEKSVILLNLTTFFFSVNQDYQILTDCFSLSDRPSLSTSSIGSVRPGPCCPITLLLIFCVTASVWTSHRWREVSPNIIRCRCKNVNVCILQARFILPMLEGFGHRRVAHRLHWKVELLLRVSSTPIVSTFSPWFPSILTEATA